MTILYILLMLIFHVPFNLLALIIVLILDGTAIVRSGEND